MQFKHVTLDFDGPVAVLKLDHQEVMNAVSLDMLGSLGEALDAIEDKRAEVRCLVITGAGRAFCTGANLQGRNTQKPGRSNAGAALETAFHPFLRRLRTLHCPIVTSVNGPAAGVGLMCAAMFTRAIAWHAILAAAPTWRRAKRRDAMQGTFIGVLMSATLPARLGEPSRALVVARRIGRARETLPVVLGTMVSQTLLNLLALLILGGVTLSSVSVLDGHDRALLLIALAPLAALLALAIAPVLIPPAALSRSRRSSATTAFSTRSTGATGT